MAYGDFLDANELTFAYSDRESSALGLQIYRCCTTQWDRDSHEIAIKLNSSNADVVILRTKNVEPNFQAMDGDWISISAGELVYWASPVNPRFGGLAKPLEYVAAQSKINEFADVVRRSFADYKNHYSANPLFDRLSPEQAYVDWAIRRASETTTEDLAGLLLSNGQPVGAISGVQIGTEVEIELAGIAPEFQGQGMYAHLIAGFWQTVNDATRSRIVISTQKENESVQKAWVRLGLSYEFSVVTTHLVRRTLIEQ